MNKPAHTQKHGFTLIELMLAIVLSSIIFMTCGVILLSSWKTSKKLMDEKHLTQETQLLAQLFTDQVQSASIIVSKDNLGRIDFTSDGKTSRIQFANDKIMYYPDTSVSSKAFALLDGATLNFTLPPENTSGAEGNLYTMRIRIFESDTHQTNTYSFTALSS